MNAAGKVLAGRYEVIRSLGESTVVVRDQEAPGPDGRRVLRILTSETVRTIRFELERTMAIDHAHVAKVHALGELEDGSAYYVQDLVEGEDLFQWALARNPIDVVLVFAQLLDGLGQYHDLGLVPGGKRPMVIKVEQPGGPETARLRLIDPGGVVEEFSREAIPSDHTRALAPERRTGARVDRRASLYEAGLFLYELLAGSDSGIDLSSMDLEGSSPPPVSQLAPGLPLDLATFVMVILRPYPDDRPATVSVALDTLEKVCGQQLVERERVEPRPPLPTACLARGAELERLAGWAQPLLTPLQTRGRRAPASVEPEKHPSVVVIHGPPGIGKRRLLDEFALRLALEDVVLLRAACGQGGQGPLGPFAEVFRELLKAPSLRRRLAHAPESAHWALRALLPELSAQLPAGAGPPPLEDADAARLRLYDALALQLVEIARDRPLAILLSDLELARAPTWEFLLHLGRVVWSARRLAREARPTLSGEEARAEPRLMILATSAEEPVEDDLGPFAGLLPVRELALEDLLRLASSALGDETCPPGLREAVELYAHGHPGRAIDLVRRHIEGREPPRPSTDERAILPEDFCESLLSQLGDLLPQERRLIELIGLLDRPAPVHLLTRATSTSRRDCERALNRLVELGLLERTSGRSYALAYAGLGAGLAKRLEVTGPGERARLAGFLAEGIPRDTWKTRLERPLEVAELAAAAGPEAPIELLQRFGGLATSYLESLGAQARAGQLVLRRAAHESDPAEAFALRRRAAALLLEGGEAAEAEQVLRELVDEPGERSTGDTAGLWRDLTISLLAQDQVREARRALSWAHTHLEEDAEAFLARAEVAALGAELHIEADEREEANQRCQEGLELLKGQSLDAVGNRLRARLLGSLGKVLMLDEDFKQATQMHRAALAIQEREGLRAEAARTLQRMGNVEFAAGRDAQAESNWAACLEQYEGLGDRARIAQVCSSLALVSARRGALSEARELLRESVRLRQEGGDRRGTAASLHNLGYVYACAGALEEAARAYRRCLALRLQEDDRWYAASASNNLGEVLLDLGQPQAARQHLLRALEARRELGDRRGQAASLAHLAELELRTGEISPALQHLEVARRIREEHNDPDDQVDTLRRRARFHLTLGRLQEAQADVSEAITLAGKHALNMYEAPNHLLLGEILARRKRRTPARRELERARRAAERIGDRLTARAAALELCALRLASGKPADARALLDSRPVPRPGSLKPLEGRLAVDQVGQLRVRERLLRARIELSLEAGSVVTAARCAEQALAEARRAELGDLEWRALQALAATAELRGESEQALALTLEAQERVEQLVAQVPEEYREVYLSFDPLRTAALKGDSPLTSLGVLASYESTDLAKPLAEAGASEQLLRAMVESTLPTIQPARAQGDTPPPQRKGGVELLERGTFDALVRLNRLIVDEPNVASVLETIVKHAVQLCGAERGFVALFAESPDDARVLATSNMDDVESQGQRFFRRCAFKAASTGQLVLSAEARVVPERKREGHVVGLGLRSVLAAPVSVPDGRRGALYLDHPFQIGRFTDAEVDLLEALADQCAMAIGRSVLEAALHQRHGIAPGVEQRQYLRAKAGQELAPVHLGDPTRGLIGCSEAMRAAIETLERVAEKDVAVLVEGPPGVGKGVAARALHDASKRAGPLIAIDLRELESDGLARELFGSVRVEGTEDAEDADTIGLFRSAEGGTLLLEHIGQAPLEVLLKLERAIEERSVRPLGATEPVPFDARVAATSSEDLVVAIREGRFPESLFLLVAEARVSLPPLDERPEDKGPLIDALLSRWKRKGRPPVLSSDARAHLEGRSYPGNARELNAILAACAALAGDGPIRPEDLPVGRPKDPPPLREALESFERKTIASALLVHGGDLTKTATALGISRRSLKRKLDQLQIAP